MCINPFTDSIPEIPAENANGPTDLSVLLFPSKYMQNYCKPEQQLVYAYRKFLLEDHQTRDSLSWGYCCPRTLCLKHVAYKQE